MRNNTINDAVIVVWETEHWYNGTDRGQFAYRMYNGFDDDETEEEYINSIKEIIDKKVYRYDSLKITIHYIFIDNKHSTVEYES